MNDKKSSLKTANFHYRLSSAEPAVRTHHNTKVPPLNFSSFLNSKTKRLSPKTQKNAVKISPKKQKEVYKAIFYEDPQKEFESLEVPVSSEKVLENFSVYLTEIEKSEILSLGKIYFLPLNIPKLLIKEGNLPNFDDETGDYNLILGESLLYRFEILEILGRGSFSQVCKCLDHKKSEVVAVKIIKNKRNFISQSAVEIRLLENINQKDLEDSSNIIHLKETFVFRNHVCLVFEQCSINLYQLLRLNQFKGLSQKVLKKIASQLLVALRFLRTCHIVHCDLKPENILLQAPDSSIVKLIDLGSGCYEHERLYTYIQARYYRSPEVLLGMSYTTAIDMWSLGCVLVEMHTSKPLFPANNEVELMAFIQQIIGTPPADMVAKSPKKQIFFDSENRPRLIYDDFSRVIRPGTRRLEDALKASDSKFVDFINRCLQWDPRKRLTPEDALRHDWLSESSQKKKQSRDLYH